MSRLDAVLTTDTVPGSDFTVLMSDGWASAFAVTGSGRECHVGGGPGRWTHVKAAATRSGGAGPIPISDIPMIPTTRLNRRSITTKRPVR
jgi:hypothetical protein